MKIKQFFLKTFGIRSGEFAVSLLLQLYVFIIISTLLIVKPTVNALFLSELTSEALPYAFLLVALVAVATSFFYNKALKHFPLNQIITVTILVSSLVFISLKIILSLKFFAEWLLYIYYVWVALFALLTTSQFWLLANLVFNIRQAKRLFGFIGAGAITGGIVGGYLTTLLAPKIGNENLILIAAVLILACIPILNFIWNRHVKKLGFFRQKQRSEYSKDTSFKLVLKSKHLTYIAGIIGLGVLMAKLVDYQFSDLAYRKIPDSDELASFFGFWFSTFNVISLGIQLFFTRRVLNFLGVTTSLLLLPIGIGVAAVLFLVFPELWVVIIIKAIDGSFKQSVNKASTELLYLPVSNDLKKKTKAFIDVVVDSIATGIAGCLLIFVIRGLKLPTIYVTLIILILIVVWVIVIFKVRKSYYNAFRSNLLSFAEKTSSTTPKKVTKATKETVIEVLEKGEDSEILYMLKRINSISDKRLKTLVIQLLHHKNPRIQAEAISNLYHLDKGTAIVEVEKLVHSKNDYVVFSAMEYLLTHTYVNNLKIFNSYLNHDDPYISSVALLCLSKESRDNASIGRQYDLHNRLEQAIINLNLPSEHHRTEETIELLRAVGYSHDPKYYSFITAHFNNRDERVVLAAIRAAGDSAAAVFINYLLDFLLLKKYREEAMEALFKFGPQMIKTLRIMLHKGSVAENAKQFIPAIMAKFETQSAVDELFKLLRHKDIVLRLESAKALNKIKNNKPKLTFSKRRIVRRLLTECKMYQETLSAMSLQKQISSRFEDQNNFDYDLDEFSARQSLIDLLDRRLENGLVQIFQLLGLRYQQKDIDIAYQGIISEKKDMQANAIEFLDTLLTPNLKSTLLPIVENTTLVASNDVSDTMLSDIPSEYTCFKRLLKGRDLKIKLAVLYLLKHLNDKRYLKLVKPLINHHHKKIRTFAIQAKDNLQSL